MSYVEQAERDRAAAQLRSLQDQLARLQRERGGREQDELKAVQTRADGVMALFGKRARDPSLGESVRHYRASLAQELAEHSRYKGANLQTYDAQSIAAAEDAIYTDAAVAARDAMNKKPGILVAERTRDESGRMITRWHGDPMEWMKFFCTGGQVGFVRKPEGRAPGM